MNSYEIIISFIKNLRLNLKIKYYDICHKTDISNNHELFLEQ